MADSNPIQKTVLPNGVRVVTESVPYVGSASIGIWCRTGSVDESSTEGGITHLIEHMLFKGTENRDAKQIAAEIEGRGGMLNAFTDKEKTCYYCRVLSDDIAVGLDVLSDMVVHSKIDHEELSREKGVVLEEIKRSEDEPGDQVHELHLERLWPDHPLGLPVIGTKESVSSFEQGNIRTYMDRRYLGGHILVAAAGKVDHEQIVDLVSPTLGKLKAGEAVAKNPRPNPVPGKDLIAKEIEQVHFCIGGKGLSYYDDDLYSAVVLDGILGSGMSSRLFQEVREKRGLAYSIGSYMLSYSSGGAFTIYGGTGMATWDEVVKIVNGELEDLQTNGPTDDELAKVKRLLSGNLLLGLEGMSARMMRMAKNEYVYGRYISADETRKKIEAVTGEQVKAVAASLFQKEGQRITAIGPFGKS